MDTEKLNETNENDISSRNKIESYLKNEFQLLVNHPRLIRTLYQFSLIMVGYYAMTLVARGYSVFNALVIMGLFFAIIFIIPLPHFAKLKVEGFNDLANK